MTIIGGLLDTFMQKAAPERPPQGAGSFGGLFTGSSMTSQSTLANLNTYGAVPWLFAVVSRIATAVASVEWHLYQRAPNGEREEVTEHPLIELFEGANPFTSDFTFTETFQQHLELAGNAYWMLVGTAREPLELWPLRPDRVRAIPHPAEFIGGWEYVIGSLRLRLEPEEVVHLAMPSPLDPYIGMSPVRSLAVDLDAEKKAAQWSRNFYENGTTISGFIETDETWDDAQYERFLVHWKAEHRGVANAHKVAILEHAKFHEAKYTQRDMQFDATRRLTRDLVFGAYGIHPSIMGVSESVNRANAEAAEVHFARWLVKPRLVRIRGARNKVARIFDDKLEWDFDNPVPQDREHRLRMAEVGFDTKSLTLDERRALLDHDKIDGDGGDELPAAPAPLQLSAKAADDADIKPQPVDTQEDRVGTAWARRLRSEVDALVAYLEPFTGRRIRLNPKRFTEKIEIGDLDGYDWDWWAKYGKDVVAELTESFSLSMLAAVGSEVLTDEVQRVAGVYAEHRAAQLLQVTGDMNLASATRQRVRELVAQSITDGQSLGQLSRALREDFVFSRGRAERIARTETATALGQGQKQAAIHQGRDQKRWVSQGDDRVNQPICATNEAQGWVGVADAFQSGHDTIPGHVQCRCTVIYRTAPLPELTEGAAMRDVVTASFVAAAHEHDESVVNGNVLAEFRCPEDGLLLGKDVAVGTSFYCRKCKVERTA